MRIGGQCLWQAVKRHFQVQFYIFFNSQIFVVQCILNQHGRVLLPIFLLLSHPTHPTDLRLCENRFVFCDGDIFLDYCNCDISMSHLLWFNCSWKKCGLLNFINLFPLFLFWLWFRNTVYWVWLIWFCVSTYYSIFVHFHVNILSYPH